jgi:hypothetical protein
MSTLLRASRSALPTAHLLLLPLALLLVLAPPATAVDGVLEINQACAVSTGCFAGDEAGFPVTITSAGVSVRLTSSLTVPSASTTAISVNAADVTVDLNGFRILGPTICSGIPLACVPAGTGDGVAGPHPGTVVSNGTIRGMGRSGVALGDNARVIGIRAVGNGTYGIATTLRGLVSGCVVTRNGATGIYSDHGVIRDNVSSGNGDFGVDAFASTITGNTIRTNEGFGLNASANTGYGHNHFSNNNGGDANPQVSSGLEIAPNVCGGDLICP